MTTSRNSAIVVLAFVISLISGSVSSAGVSAEASAMREAILSIEKLPTMPVYRSGDSTYWNLVRQGQSALPHLLSLAADPTPTRIPVDYYGGSYSVGDIAIKALREIVHGLPVDELAQGPVDGELRHLRNAAYWSYVRASDANRHSLRNALEGWFAENQGQLQWFAARSHPAGGWYVLSKSAKRAGGYADLSTTATRRTQLLSRAGVR